MIFKRSRRYRGWYRAAKRGEEWAVKHFKKTALFRIMEFIYRFDTMADLIYKDNPFLKLLPKEDDSWRGVYYPVPLFTWKVKGRKRKHYRNLKNDI